MSLAYPVNRVIIKTVVGMMDHKVNVDSVWETGNLLFRSRQRGVVLQEKISAWANALDAKNRVYILWHADAPRANGLIVQRLDSHYCFEALPFKP